MWKLVSDLSNKKMQILVTDEEPDDLEDPRFPGYYSSIELINWPPTHDGRVMCQNSSNYQSIWFKYWMEIPEKRFSDG